MVPRSVLDKLIAEEKQSGVYRTRVAANVLCKWRDQPTQWQGL
jgi:hypothetical protein